MKIDLLAIVAHPDDAELCCGGTLIKHQQEGFKIGIVDLTQGELGSRGSRDIRMEEAKRASELLKLSGRESLDLGDGKFENTHEDRLPIIQQIRRFQPEIVITNALSDRHPDHGRSAKLVADACFFSGLVRIETQFEGEAQQAWRPKNVWHMMQDHYHHPDIVIDVTDQWEKRQEAILAFSTQFHNPNDTSAEPKTPISGKDFWNFLDARGREMGRLIRTTYGEGFIKSRPVGVNNLFDLK